MLIAVASDAHGARRCMDALIDALPTIDAFCFLGDMDRDGQYLDYGVREKQPGAAFYAVAGNNDPFSRMPTLIEQAFGGVKTLLAHGHLYHGIRASRDSLARRAASDGCALALYGHTHNRCDEEIRGVRLINPGALMRGEWALVSIADGRVEVIRRV